LPQKTSKSDKGVLKREEMRVKSPQDGGFNSHPQLNLKINLRLKKLLFMITKGYYGFTEALATKL